jgi:hypothetical protein
VFASSLRMRIHFIDGFVGRMGLVMVLAGDVASAAGLLDCGVMGLFADTTEMILGSLLLVTGTSSARGVASAAQGTWAQSSGRGGGVLSQSCRSDRASPVGSSVGGSQSSP